MAGESPRDLLEIASGFAEEAGRITLDYFQGHFVVDTKPDASFVTAADREAEAFVRAAIESRFPEDGIVGEEFGEVRPDARRRWIIDPIDGTFSFVHGVPVYGVLVGVEEDGEPLAGVIHLPPLGETIAAARGEGCYWRGRRAQVSGTAELKDALVLTTEMNLTGDPARSAALGRLLSAAGPASLSTRPSATGRAGSPVRFISVVRTSASSSPAVCET